MVPLKLQKRLASSVFNCGRGMVSHGQLHATSSSGGASSTSVPKLWLSPSVSSPFCSSAPAISSAAPTPPASSVVQPQEIRRELGWSKWLLFLPGAITFGLGTWQIFRREEKMKMLEFRRKRLDLEPIKFKDVSSSSEKLDFEEFRRVKCQGVLDVERSIYVGPRSRSISGVTENGYYIITPLMPIPNNPESVQSPVLVNRGWVPRSWRDKSFELAQDGDQALNVATPSLQEKKQSSWWRFWSKEPKNTEDQVPAISPVEVIGVVRGSEKPNHFIPENIPSSGEWFYVDVSAIARTLGLPENTMYIEDIDESVDLSNPYPIPKDVNTLIRTSVMPQDHLNYTMTWYSLSAAVTFMATKRLKQKKFRR